MESKARRERNVRKIVLPILLMYQSVGGNADSALLPAQFRDHALQGRGGPAESHEDRGPQRIPDHGGRYGGRVQEGEYRRQEEPVRAAAKGAGSVRDPISQGRQLSLISRSFGFGNLCRFGDPGTDLYRSKNTGGQKGFSMISLRSKEETV